MGNTEQIVRETVSKTSKASPVLLRGTLWVSAGVLAIIVKTLLEWKGHEEKVTPLDVKILFALVLWEMCKTWLTYIDSSFAHWKQERTEEKKRLSETEWARQQIAAATPPPKP